MKRAISPIVATILIITVTVALAGGLLIFIMNLQSKMTTSSAEAPTLYNLRISPGTVACQYNSTSQQLNLTFYGEAIGEEIPADVELILTIKKSTGETCMSASVTVGDVFGGNPVKPGSFTEGTLQLTLSNGATITIGTHTTTWQCASPSDKTVYVLEFATAKSAQPAIFSIEVDPDASTCTAG